MGMFEKRRFRKMLVYINNWEEENPKTHDGLDLKAVPMRAVYDKFGLEEGTRAFTGHAMALQTDDSYLDKVSHKPFRAPLKSSNLTPRRLPLASRRKHFQPRPHMAYPPSPTYSSPPSQLSRQFSFTPTL
jgi:Rab GDP dissociation inhibitor